jgi:DHA1 family bicyclomycin/chloramphenicol resistance-like MFS transporter
MSYLRKYFGLFSSIALIEMVMYLSDDMYLPAMLTIAQDYNTTLTMVQHTLSGWYLGGAVFQLFIIPISSRIGCKKTILLGVAIFFISSLGCYFADTIEAMIFMRFFQGARRT